jgi:hypothetical protein
LTIIWDLEKKNNPGPGRPGFNLLTPGCHFDKFPKSGSVRVWFIFEKKRGCMTEKAKQDDDSIIELTEVVEDGEDVEDTLSDDILSENEILDDSPFELTDMDDFSDADMDFEEAGMENPAGDMLSKEASVSEETFDFGETSDADEISVSEKQIEAALERVIEKKFAEKIEPLIFDTVERVILQEIKKIKAALLEDVDRNGPF